MHLFLTGEPGVGKSTALRRTLDLLEMTPGGFRTVYAPGGDTLHLVTAWEGGACDPRTIVAVRAQGCAVPDRAAFDRLGAEAIAQSRPWARLLLFDECGKLERQALRFQRAVLDALDGPVPILGVIKPERADSWLMEIERHRAVEIISVTEKNRDGLPQELAARVRDAR